MSSEAGESISYCCRRVTRSEKAVYVYSGAGSTREAAFDSLEFFLLERYYLFARRGNSLVRAQVSHAPYQFRRAQLTQSSTLPALWAGFSGLNDTVEHSCFVDGFDVKVYATARIGQA